MFRSISGLLLKGQRKEILSSVPGVQPGACLFAKKEKLYLKRNSGAILGGTGPNAAWAYKNERQWY